MGNIASQIGNSSHKYKVEPPSEPTQLSLPRLNQQQKVLPVSKEPPPKLKPTENGKILHAGGTLSGRHQDKTSRGNFMNAKEKVKFLREIHEEKSQHVHHQKETIKKFGSEPDLRYHLKAERASAKPKRYIGTKKFSQTNSLEKRSQELENFCENVESFSTKRIGLFKTRVESRKHNLSFNSTNKSPVNARRNVLDKVNDNNQYQLQETVTRNVINSQIISNLEYFKEDLKEVNMRKYYFGMDNNIESMDYLNYEIQDYDVTKLSDEIRSNLSNFGEEEDNQTISLYLRPILPKKQLEMPKFSSSLAWKLLYSADYDSNLDGSTTNNEDEQLLLEDRIEKVLPAPAQRFLPNKSLDFQFSQDKSGDSGISGDETPKPTLSHYKSKQSWTPQQDLGDDSSTDEEIRFNSVPYASNANKPHIFSLSLPRDHMEWYKTQTRLQTGESTNKLKRSVSGVFGNCVATNGEATTNTLCSTKNFNWLLSKSAPNSLNNGFNSLESTYVYNETLTSLVPLNGHQNAKGRIMYLPDSDINDDILSRPKKGTENVFCDGKNEVCENFVEEVEKREQERLKEIETMQRIEEEFRRKRSRYNNLYSNSRQNFRKVLLSAGEKSV